MGTLKILNSNGYIEYQYNLCGLWCEIVIIRARVINFDEI